MENNRWYSPYGCPAGVMNTWLGFQAVAVCWMFSLTNLTEPSAMQNKAPPGWLLAAVRAGWGFPSGADQLICHCPFNIRAFEAPAAPSVLSEAPKMRPRLV